MALLAMPLTLHHVALGAVSVASIARFYGALFGLRELARHHHPDGTIRSIWLELEGPSQGAPVDVGSPAILMIEHTEEPERRTLIGRGPFLLAFRIPRGERAAFEERLAAMGIEVESRTSYSSYFRDPEGNRVAISHHPEP
jgi:glyoxylase I family protein